MEKAPSYASYVARCMEKIRSAMGEASWSANQLRLRLGWTSDLKTLYRYLDYPNNPSSIPTADFLFGCAHVFGIDLNDASGLPRLKPPAQIDCDPRYVKAQLKGRRFSSPCAAWAREIREYFRDLKLPIRVQIAPTHDFSDNPAEKLTMLGMFGALEVERALFKNGPTNRPHVILQGLGKHMNALVHALLSRHKSSANLIWLPAMGDDNHWDYFTANNFCEALSGHLGGSQPITLNTPSFVEFGNDEYLHYVHADPSYRNLFDRPVPGGPHRDYCAWEATTALLGCGVAAPGNPLYESPKRQRDSSRLGKGDYPAVGDLNGFYQCVSRDGTPAWLDHKCEFRNQEASDANRRAIGAPPELLKTIADRYRHNSKRQGGGVIVLANAAARAPVVYNALHLAALSEKRGG